MTVTNGLNTENVMMTLTLIAILYRRLSVNLPVLDLNPYNFRWHVHASTPALILLLLLPLTLP